MMVCATLTDQMVGKIDLLIEQGYVKSRSEFIRNATVDKIRNMEDRNG